MERYLNTGIKDVIQHFPQVGAILGKSGIDCVTCAVGTCLLKDVVQIHGLPREQETVLMAEIEKAIKSGPGGTVSISAPAPSLDAPRTETAKRKYSPPIKKLVQEHERIKRLLALIPGICNGIAQGEMDPKLIDDCLYYIRNYADRFHHAKEEEILFKFCDENRDIIQVMLQEHQAGRNYITSVAGGLERNDKQQVARGLTEYRQLLQQHIEKEDRILYPWIDRNLSTRQVGELAARFAAVNDVYARQLGEDIQARFEAFLNIMEAQLK